MRTELETDRFWRDRDLFSDALDLVFIDTTSTYIYHPEETPLRQRYLTDIPHNDPHNDALGVKNSFFDQAEIRFGGRIRLREHFRCMLEIIQFSKGSVRK